MSGGQDVYTIGQEQVPVAEPDPAGQYVPLSGKLPLGVHISGIDPAKIKLRELAEVERVLGRKLAEEVESGQLGMDTMTGFLWIMVRREFPPFTFEDAGEFDLQSLMELFASDDGPPQLLEGVPDPTPATRNGGGISASSNGVGA